MGQMIKITYVGAFIVPKVQDWQSKTNTDEFYESFIETGKFITAYQGLESIDVLIPSENKYALKNHNDYHDEFIIDDFDALSRLSVELSEEYKDQLKLLTEFFPDSNFFVRSGVVSYWDEIA